MALWFVFIVAFIVGFLAYLVAAGPSTFLIFRNALMKKYKNCVALLLGSAVMEMIYFAVALFIIDVIISRFSHFQLFGRGLGFVIFLSVGIYFLFNKVKINSNGDKVEYEEWESRKHFFRGMWLVALNPMTILSWSVISAALVSLGVVVLDGFFNVGTFILGIGAGIVFGGLAMVLLLRIYSSSFSEKFIQKMMRGSGIILIALALYFLYRFLALLLL